MQDSCCDTCECCPSKSPKTVQTKDQSSKPIQPEVGKPEIPFGYGLIHSGARMESNAYTCPVLEIHIWRKAETHAPLNKASISKRGTVESLRIQQDLARQLGPFRGAIHRRIEVQEEIIVIPIETILSIKSSSEVQKEEIERRNVRSRPSPFFKLSCCERIRQWCCPSSKNRFSKRQEEIISTFSNQQAQRKVLMTIEYIPYSNIDSPSHIRVLPLDDQLRFFKENFYRNVSQFYLLKNDIFEQYDFDFKREQAATLCRLVTQLKAMVGHYPDELTLERIIGNPDILAIGNPAEENFTRLAGSKMITAALESTLPSEWF